MNETKYVTNAMEGNSRGLQRVRNDGIGRQRRKMVLRWMLRHASGRKWPVNWILNNNGISSWKVEGIPFRTEGVETLQVFWNHLACLGTCQEFNKAETQPTRGGGKWRTKSLDGVQISDGFLHRRKQFGLSPEGHEKPLKSFRLWKNY